jgi:hypothetical protein
MPTIDISAGTLPPPTCYASEQDRLDAYAAALIGNLNTGAEWASSQTVPGNPGLYWLRTDISNRPVEVLKFSSAAGDAQFIRLSSEVVFAGTASGAAGVYAVINSPPYPSPASAYRTGQIYTFIANHTNTAGCTLNVDGQGAKTITKDATVALSANDILTGQVVSVLYDGVNFQLLSQKRDLTRLSLKQFLTYASAPIPIVQNGVLMPFNHGFGVMPFMVRAVLIRQTGVPGSFSTFTDSLPSPAVTFDWYEGQEVDCLNFVADRTSDLPAFKYLCDPTQVNVQAVAFNSTLGGIIFPYMTPPLGTSSNASDYRIKVYATALNPAYVP